MKWRVKQLTLLGLVLAAMGDGSGRVKGDSVATTRFTEIAGASFIEVPRTNALDPITLPSGSILTYNRTLVNGVFGGPFTGTPDDPGDGFGYASILAPINPDPTVIVDFSSPLAAFGVSFFGDPPARLDVFDGPGGTGSLIGSISSIGFHDGVFQDFVGIWSDRLNIRSAVLSRISPGDGFSVDGYGVSITTVPEPGSLVLLGFGGLALIGYSRRRRGRGKVQQNPDAATVFGHAKISLSGRIRRAWSV